MRHLSLTYSYTGGTVLCLKCEARAAEGELTFCQGIVTETNPEISTRRCAECGTTTLGKRFRVLYEEHQDLVDAFEPSALAERGAGGYLRRADEHDERAESLAKRGKRILADERRMMARFLRRRAALDLTHLR